jgi:hypothetical protein
MLSQTTGRPASSYSWPGVSQIRIGQDEKVVYTFVDENNNRLGILLDGATGNFELGGWDSQGNWVSLIPMLPCTTPGCKYPDNHCSPFTLNQYDG